MAARFHIEELISQDLSGVIFRANDQESGAAVAIRRFFPYGMDGGGLLGEEKTAYEISIQRFACASHPALRTVIDGGCDPVDGLPFIVTEWLEGESISKRLAGGPLQSRQAIDIIMRALEISEVLSELLAEQAVWVETDTLSIIETTGQTARGVTFWISPLKWLGANEDRRSLKPIVQLTEDLMGWKNKLINDQAGNGLAAWLKWLRQYASTTTLAEARETLAAATGAPPPPPTSRLVRQSTRPLAPRAATLPVAQVTRKVQPKSKSLKLPIILAAAGLLIAVAAGGFILRERIPFLAKMLPAKTVITLGDDESVPALDPAAAKEPPAGPFSPMDDIVLNGMSNKRVIVRGVLEGVSDKGKAVYLEFEKAEPYTYACGYVIKEGAPANMTESQLKPLIGKTVRLTGILTLQKSPKRPQILLTGRESIEVE